MEKIMHPEEAWEEDELEMELESNIDRGVHDIQMPKFTPKVLDLNKIEKGLLLVCSKVTSAFQKYVFWDRFQTDYEDLLKNITENL